MDDDLKEARFLYSVAFAPEDLDRLPFYAALSHEFQDSETALRLLAHVVREQRNPMLLFAALHYLALNGHPDLQPIYDRVRHGEMNDVGRAAHEVVRVLQRDEGLVRHEMRRSTQTNEAGRSALLQGVLRTVAPEERSINLIDVGTSAGINLWFDQFTVSALAHDDPLTLQCEDLTPLDRSTPLPNVEGRIGIDLNPLDLARDDDRQWLRACLWPEDPIRPRRLEVVIEHLSSWPTRTMLRGDALEQLPNAIGLVDDSLLTVVVNTWFAAYLTATSQSAYFDMITGLCVRRNVAWISIEGNYGIDWPSPYNASRPTRPGASQIIVCAAGGRPQHFGWCHPHGRWLARDVTV